MNWYKTYLKVSNILSQEERDKINDDFIKEISDEYRKLWVPINSSLIREISYNEQTKILKVHLTNSYKTYSFPNISKETYEAFLNSPSKGIFFNNLRRKTVTAEIEPINDDKSLEEKSLKELEDEQKPLGVEAYTTIGNNGNITLHTLRVDKDKRKQGLGTAFMEDLCRKADSLGKTIELNLGDRESGETTSKNRLIEFYKRFGFVRNFGRTKDYRLSCQMYRRPRSKQAFNLNWYKMADTENDWFDIGHGMRDDKTIGIWIMDKAGNILSHKGNPKEDSHSNSFSTEVYNKNIAVGRMEYSTGRCSIATDRKDLIKWIKQLLKEKFGNDIEFTIHSKL